MKSYRLLPALLVFAGISLSCSGAAAFFHLWRFTEFFSNADGSVQFIELHSSGSGETQAIGAEIRSASTGKVLALTQNLSGSTFDKSLLLATPGFHTLMGAVPPDFPLTPLPTNFFNPAGDTITLFHHGVIDTKTFTSVPTDGLMSRVYPSNTLATNSPTNFAGQAGSVDLALLPGDYNDNGTVDAADYVLWRDNVGAVITLPNDTTPEWVMEEDYPVWRANFGRTSGNAAGFGSTNANAAPEPQTQITFLIAMFALVTLERKVQRFATRSAVSRGTH
jgi:hypothetical protein